ncbi:epimerase family protein SDR39U1 isoform X3 [Choloepus didactylus]|uniref:epimerase family protein SDR39U1 isoform X3 n=1 Tax=Choloepus didactylus TaxID=27675 RepID=UPI0018A0007E|nr:epimerase family protein SDR39U1 isoform X3 [Choloepus didactylus]
MGRRVRRRWRVGSLFPREGTVLWAGSLALASYPEKTNFPNPLWPVISSSPGGGTGFIGTALTQLLKAKGHEVTLVSRKPGPDRITWDELSASGLPPCDAAVNLAGVNILNPLRRWNEAFQKEVLSSRLETTHMLATAITKAPQPPKAWVLVTGVGVVLGRGGGAISHMLLPFRLGLGGPIGSGHQFFPWIHIGDLAGILAHALEASHVQGVLNGVAPASTTTNADFAQALGAALGRPAFIPLPSTVVQAIFGRERAIMLLEGQKVVPRRTLAAGYQYAFPVLGAALKEVVA